MSHWRNNRRDNEWDCHWREIIYSQGLFASSYFNQSKNRTPYISTCRVTVDSFQSVLLDRSQVWSRTFSIRDVSLENCTRGRARGVVDRIAVSETFSFFSPMDTDHAARSNSTVIDPSAHSSCAWIAFLSSKTLARLTLSVVAAGCARSVWIIAAADVVPGRV